MWSIEHLRVTFGATVALDDVSFEVDDGEIVVILGPSGCGKSTLLRVIAGLQPPESGALVIDGVNVTDRLPHQRDIGLMFQEPMLFPHRNIGQNIEFGLRMERVGGSERRDRVREMLALVGMAGFGDRDVATLSGGEAQRVALARALAPRPRMLLLDEPFGALDRSLRDRLINEIPALLRATGTAAIHVTHDHDEAFAIADRVGIMTAGRLVRIGAPEEVFADPQTETVARFLGHTNIIGDTAAGTRRVIRRDAASVDPTGDLVGVVVGSRFRGDHYDVDIETSTGFLSFRLDIGLVVGTDIRLRINPDRTAAIRSK